MEFIFAELAAVLVFGIFVLGIGMYSVGNNVIVLWELAEMSGSQPAELNFFDRASMRFYLWVRFHLCVYKIKRGLSEMGHVSRRVEKAMGVDTDEWKVGIPASGKNLITTFIPLLTAGFSLLAMWYISQLGNGIIIMSGLNFHPDPIPAWVTLSVVFVCSFIGLLAAAAMTENRKLA